MAKILEQIEQVYLKACDAEAKARAAGGNLQLGESAASDFRQASRLSSQAAEDGTLDEAARIQAAIYAKYYQYCHHKTLCWVAYETRDCRKALLEGTEGLKSLEDGIKLIDVNVASLGPDIRKHLESQERSWEFERQFAEVMTEAVEGRQLWDSGRFVDATDHYRRAVAKGKALVEDVQQQGVPSASERILIGNIYGMMSNASKALTKLIFERGRSGDGQPSLLDNASSVELLRHNFEAYQFDMAAYRTNPEWQQYWDSAQACLGNLKQFLEDNPGAWLETFMAFEHEPEFLFLMKQIDPEKYRQVESARFTRDHGTARLWGIGSFWLMAFLVVAGAVYLLLSVGWWSALLAIAGLPVLFLIITAAILRSAGDLSEAGFLETIKLSLKFLLSGAARFINGAGHDRDGK